MEEPTVTAVRIWHGKTPKVHVVINGTEQKLIGGSRAARCGFVLVCSYEDDNGKAEDGSEGYGRRYAGMHTLLGLRSAEVSRSVNRFAYGYLQHFTEQTFPITEDAK